MLTQITPFTPCLDLALETPQKGIKKTVTSCIGLEDFRKSTSAYKSGDYRTASWHLMLGTAKVATTTVALTVLGNASLKAFTPSPMPSPEVSPFITLDVPLATQLKTSTDKIHAEITNHPFVEAIFTENDKEMLNTSQYFAYLIDLKCIYLALEESIRKSLAKEPRLKAIYFKNLERSEALQKDIQSLGLSTVNATPSTPAKNYQEHLESLSDTYPLLYVAHSYTRYMADVSGGNIVKGRLEKRWPASMQFYNFEDVVNEHSLNSQQEFKSLFKARMNIINITAKELEDLLSETDLAFRLSARALDTIIPSHRVW